MATTTNNGWETPDDTDLVKDGALAIRDLGQDIDTSVGEGLLAWKTWAPTLSGGWANGNGTWTAVYCQIGKTVHVFGRFIVGTTTTKGTNLFCSVPVQVKANRLANLFPVRGVAAGSPFLLVGRFISQTLFAIEANGAAGTYVGTGTGITATIPATWATSDDFAFSFTYETS
jgi:hypothetical protein